MQMRKKSQRIQMTRNTEIAVGREMNILSGTEADPVIGKFRPVFPPAVLEIVVDLIYVVKT